MKEIHIVRNATLPRLFNVVEVDFETETVRVLFERLEWDDAVMKIKSLVNCRVIALEHLASACFGCPCDKACTL